MSSTKSKQPNASKAAPPTAKQQLKAPKPKTVAAPQKKATVQVVPMPVVKPQRPRKLKADDGQGGNSAHDDWEYDEYDKANGTGKYAKGKAVAAQSGKMFQGGAQLGRSHMAGGVVIGQQGSASADDAMRTRMKYSFINEVDKGYRNTLATCAQMFHPWEDVGLLVADDSSCPCVALNDSFLYDLPFGYYGAATTDATGVYAGYAACGASFYPSMTGLMQVYTQSTLTAAATPFTNVAGATSTAVDTPSMSTYTTDFFMYRIRALGVRLIVTDPDNFGDGKLYVRTTSMAQLGSDGYNALIADQNTKVFDFRKDACGIQIAWLPLTGDGAPVAGGATNYLNALCWRTPATALARIADLKLDILCVLSSGIVTVVNGVSATWSASTSGNIGLPQVTLQVFPLWEAAAFPAYDQLFIPRMVSGGSANIQTCLEMMKDLGYSQVVTGGNSELNSRMGGAGVSPEVFDLGMKTSAAVLRLPSMKRGPLKGPRPPKNAESLIGQPAGKVALRRTSVTFDASGPLGMHPSPAVYQNLVGGDEDWKVGGPWDDAIAEPLDRALSDALEIGVGTATRLAMGAAGKIFPEVVNLAKKGWSKVQDLASSAWDSFTSWFSIDGVRCQLVPMSKAEARFWLPFHNRVMSAVSDWPQAIHCSPYLDPMVRKVVRSMAEMDRYVELKKANTEALERKAVEDKDRKEKEELDVIRAVRSDVVSVDVSEPPSPKPSVVTRPGSARGDPPQRK